MPAQAIRAAVQTDVRKIEFEEFERPDVGPDEAILKVEACGICGSDVDQFLRGTLPGLAKFPLIPGHEPLGVIDEIGERAAARWNVKLGDRVAVEAIIGCGHCEACLDGRRSACSGWGRMLCYGFNELAIAPGVWGAYADYMYLHPNTVLHKVSSGMPPAIAVMFNPMGAGVHWACHAATLEMGDTVVILGAGQRGLCCVIAARAAGAGKIIVTDLERAFSKLELAIDLGADHVVVVDKEDTVARIEELTGGRMADVVVDVSAGATQPILDAIAAVRPGGTIVLAGLKRGQPIPGLVTDDLVMNSITMRGVFTVATPAYREAIRLIEQGVGAFEKMQTTTYPLAQAADAINRLAGTDGAPPAVHVAIEP